MILKFRVWDRSKFIYFTLSELYWMGEETGIYSFPDGFNVQQFTGLTDKNGKEIYEGDIVKRGKYKFIVEWGLYNDGEYVFSPGIECYMLKGMMNGLSHSPLSDGNHSGCLIIGNIYENPEPLTGE